MVYSFYDFFIMPRVEQDLWKNILSWLSENRAPQFWALSCIWAKTIRVISGMTSFSVHVQTLAYLELYSGCLHTLNEIWTAPMNIAYIHLYVTDNLPWWQARTLALLIPYPSQTETASLLLVLENGLLMHFAIIPKGVKGNRRPWNDPGTESLGDSYWCDNGTTS